MTQNFGIVLLFVKLKSKQIHKRSTASVYPYCQQKLNICIKLSHPIMSQTYPTNSLSDTGYHKTKQNWSVVNTLSLKSTISVGPDSLEGAIGPQLEFVDQLAPKLPVLCLKTFSTSFSVIFCWHTYCAFCLDCCQ